MCLIIMAFHRLVICIMNDGKGNFSDIAKARNPDIANIGMVTGAVWADLTGRQTERPGYCWRMDGAPHIFVCRWPVQRG